MRKSNRTSLYFACLVTAASGVSLLMSGCRVQAEPSPAWAIGDAFNETALSAALARRRNESTSETRLKGDRPPVWFWASEVIPFGSYTTTIEVSFQRAAPDGGYLAPDITPFDRDDLKSVFETAIRLATDQKYTGILEMVYVKSGRDRWFARAKFEKGKSISGPVYFPEEKPVVRTYPSIGHDVGFSE